MPAYYFDSSALAKRYVAEPGTVWVRRVLARGAGNSIYTVRITGAEVVSALVTRARIGTISPAGVRAAISRFKRHFRHDYDTVNVTEAVIESAMILVERHGLRGYDAVQLAAALQVRPPQPGSMNPVIFVSAD